MRTARVIRRAHRGAYAVIAARGAVLLVLKTRGPYTGAWDLPGGRIERGEQPAAALVRELCEETGLALPAASFRRTGVLRHIAVYVEGGRRVRLAHAGVVFRAALARRKRVRRFPDGRDAGGCRWFSAAALKTVRLTPFARRRLRPNAGQGSAQTSYPLGVVLLRHW